MTDGTCPICGHTPCQLLWQRPTPTAAVGRPAAKRPGRGSGTVARTAVARPGRST